MGVAMSINEINYNQSSGINDASKAYEAAKNNEKNSITSINNTQSNTKADSLSISKSSASKAEASTYGKSSSSNSSSSLITDNYMAEIVKKGKEVTKPDNVEMDDVSWGLLVQMGEKMGLTDASRLAKLTVEDVEAYFYNKNILARGKNLLQDNLTANEYVKYKNQSMNNDEYWDMVFEAKAKNQPYSINTIEKSNTGLKLSASEFFSNKGGISVTKLSSSSLHNMLMAFENDDVELFTYAAKNSTTASKNYNLEEHKKDMIEGYNLMQEYAQTAISPYEQMQIIKNALKSGNLATYTV